MAQLKQHGPMHRSVHHVRAKDDVTLIKDQQGILSLCPDLLGELKRSRRPLAVLGVGPEDRRGGEGMGTEGKGR